MAVVLLTRAKADNAALAGMLRDMQHGVVELSTVDIVRSLRPSDRTTFERNAATAACVAFTSRHAVVAVAATGCLALIPERVPLAAVGDATASALQVAGRPASLVAHPQTGTALAEMLAEVLPDAATVLCPRAAHARPELAEGLTRAGLRPVPIVCYRNVVPQRPSRATVDAALAADLVYLAAPSAGDRLYAWVPELVDRPWVAIGPTTADAITARHGHAPVAVAQSPRIVDVCAAIDAVAHNLANPRSGT